MWAEESRTPKSGELRLRVKVGVVMLPALTLNCCAAWGVPPSCLVVRGFNALLFRHDGYGIATTSHSSERKTGA